MQVRRGNWNDKKKKLMPLMQKNVLSKTKKTFKKRKTGQKEKDKKKSWMKHVSNFVHSIVPSINFNAHQKNKW